MERWFLLTFWPAVITLWKMNSGWYSEMIEIRRTLILDHSILMMNSGKNISYLKWEKLFMSFGSVVGQLQSSPFGKWPSESGNILANYRSAYIVVVNPIGLSYFPRKLLSDEGLKIGGASLIYWQLSTIGCELPLGHWSDQEPFLIL